MLIAKVSTLECEYNIVWCIKKKEEEKEEEMFEETIYSTMRAEQEQTVAIVDVLLL